MNVSKLNERSAWSRSSRTRRLLFAAVTVVAVTLGVVLAIVDRFALSGLVTSVSALVLTGITISTPRARHCEG